MMAIKMAVLLLLSFIFKLRGADRWLFGLGLAQAGEFGFVLLSFTVANSLSMLLTPALFIFYEKVIVPKFISDQTADADEIEEPGNVLIAGHGRFGGIISRMLKGAGFSTTVVDFSSAQLEMWQ